jgi:organic radical activating enzyme
MKLMDLDHISILPFLTCNFKCPYCVAKPHLYSDKQPFGLWEEKYDEVLKFIGSLDKSMILCSGGEPLLWDRWEDLIKRTDHYWYYVTNTSRIPSWLEGNEVKNKVKLFLSAYHRTGIKVGKYVDNVKKLQDMGYAVFCKIMYVKDDEQFKDAEIITKAGIPMSFVPLVGVSYSSTEIKKVKPYCQSTMYYRRFYVIGQTPCLCLAGTKSSFQIDGLTMTRCGHYSSISLNNVSKMLRGLHNGYIGDIYKSKFYNEPKICNKTECFCEYLHFGELLDDSENDKWQSFIDTRKWV